MRSILSLCLAVATLAGAGNAAHASVLWQLNDFSFNDGATATGWFRWDEASNKAVAWNIVTTPGTLGGNTYATNNSGTFSIPSVNSVNFYAGTLQFRIGVTNLDVLDTPSAHLALFAQNVGQVGPYGFLECYNCAPYRTGKEGAYLTAVTPSGDVPEPSTIALSALGMGLLAVARRKAPRRKAPRSKA